MDQIKDLSKEIAEFIANPSKCNRDLPLGRIEFANGCYGVVSSYETVKRDAKEFESHKDYLDIQMLLEGTEVIELAPVKDLTVTKPYNKEKDIIFYANNVRGKDAVLEAMEPLVIGPEEGHMPGVAKDAPQTVKKIVFKVPVHS